MTDLIPHQLKLTEAQMKKLLSGLTTKIPHKYLGADKGEVIIHLAKDNAEKLMNAYRGGAVASLKMTNPEIKHTAQKGSGFDLEKILNSPIGHKIANKVVDKAIDKLVGGKKGGAINVEKILSSPIAEKVMNKVLDKAVDKAFGGRVKKGSEEAKERMRKLREMRGMKKGSEEAKERMRKIREMRGMKKGSGDFFGNIGKAFTTSWNKPPATKAEQDLANAINRNLIASAPSAFGRINPELGEIMSIPLDPYLKERQRIDNSVSFGKGVGKGVKQSSAYKKAMKSSQGFVPDVPSVKNAPASSFGVDKRVKPSGDQMTLSPYQAPSAPAMNPFVPKTYTQEGGTQSGYGGRGLYAGKGLY
jgi:hypothetical protein